MGGRPIKKNAIAKKSQGADKQYTAGLIRQSGYHTADAARNTPPRTYSWRLSCAFWPESRVIWKLVALSI
jgi:hypothetical protein